MWTNKYQFQGFILLDKHFASECKSIKTISMPKYMNLLVCTGNKRIEGIIVKT